LRLFWTIFRGNWTPHFLFALIQEFFRRRRLIFSDGSGHFLEEADVQRELPTHVL